MPTFREVAERFLAHNALYADNPSIIAWQFKVFDRHLGERAFADVTRETLEDFFRARRAAGIATTTCNRNRQALLSFYRWAVERGLAPTNPILAIPKFKERPKQGVAISREQFAALFMAAAPHLKLYLLGLWWTGGRRTETIRLTWRWLQLDGMASITFVAENTKAHRTRTVPAPRALVRALAGIQRGGPDDPIFTYRGRPVKDMRTALKTACRRAGIPRISWHVLRRSFASLSSEQGMPLQMLQDVMGHASPETTKLYVKPSARFLAAALTYIEPGREREREDGPES